MAKQDPRDASSFIDLQEIKDFYDSVYYAKASGGLSKGMRHHYQRLFDRLRVPPGAEVLDVACGTGEWLQYCAGRGCSVAGVDLSDKAVGICRKILADGEFYAQPAESLPFGEGRFDVVTCLGSLEHFVDPVSSLREMVRVAKEDAVFVVLVPNKNFLTRRLGLFGGTYQVDAKEVVRTLDEWRALLAEGGLTVVERWKDLHVLNKSWIMKGRFYAWPVRALQALVLPIWPLDWQYQVYHRCIRSDQDPARSPVD